MGVIIRQSIKGTIVSYLGLIIGAINTIWLFTYFFTTEEYGLTKLVLSFALIVLQFSKAGVTNTFNKYYPEFRGDQHCAPSFMGLYILTPILMFLVVLAAVYFFKPSILDYYSTKSALFIEYFNYTLFLAFFILGVVLFETYARSNFRIVVPGLLKNVIVRLLTTVEIILFANNIISFPQFVFLFCVNYTLIFVAILFYAYRLNPFKVSFNFKKLSNEQIRKFFKYSVFLFLGSTAAAFVQNIDVLMVSSMIGLEATAIYTVSFFIGTLIEIPRRQLSNISTAVIAESWSKNDIANIRKIYSSSSLNQLILGGGLFLIIWLNADELFVFMPKRELYEQGKWVILYIGLARVIDMAAGVNSEIIRNSSKYFFDIISVGLLVFLCIGLNYFLIPFFGIEGAAIATLIAMFVYNAVKFLFLWFAFGLQPFNKNTFKVVLVILAFLGVFYFWPQEKEDLIITAISVLLKTLIITSLFGTIVFRLKLSKEINTLIVTVLKKLGFSSP
jgi:O-antigen/teichoic acid export membrane protein